MLINNNISIYSVYFKKGLIFKLFHHPTIKQTEKSSLIFNSIQLFLDVSNDIFKEINISFL